MNTDTSIPAFSLKFVPLRIPSLAAIKFQAECLRTDGWGELDTLYLDSNVPLNSTQCLYFFPFL